MYSVTYIIYPDAKLINNIRMHNMKNQKKYKFSYSTLRFQLN